MKNGILSDKFRLISPFKFKKQFLLSCPRSFPLSSGSQWSFPSGTNGKELPCQCRRHKRCGFNPWDGSIPRRRAWQPTQVFCLENPTDRGAWRATVQTLQRGGHGSSDSTHALKLTINLPSLLNSVPFGMASEPYSPKPNIRLPGFSQTIALQLFILPLCSQPYILVKGQAMSRFLY